MSLCVCDRIRVKRTLERLVIMKGKTSANNRNHLIFVSDTYLLEEGPGTMDRLPLVTLMVIKNISMNFHSQRFFLFINACLHILNDIRL